MSYRSHNGRGHGIGLGDLGDVDVGLGSIVQKKTRDVRSVATRIMNLALVLADVRSAFFDPLIVPMKVEMAPVDSRVQHGYLDTSVPVLFWQKFVVDIANTFFPRGVGFLS